MKRFYKFTTEYPERIEFTVNVNHIRLFEKLPKGGGYLIIFADKDSPTRQISGSQYDVFMANRP